MFCLTFITFSTSTWSILTWILGQSWAVVRDIPCFCPCPPHLPHICLQHSRWTDFAKMFYSMPFICSKSSPPQFPISLRIIFDVPTMPARPSPWPNPAPMTSSPTSFPFDLDLDTWTTFLFPGCFLQDITLLVPSARISVYLEVHVVYTSLQRGLPLLSIKN